MVSIVVFCVLNEFIICYWILGLLFSDNITGHQSLYINFGVFLLIFESCDQLGEGWMLYRDELIEAAIPCLLNLKLSEFEIGWIVCGRIVWTRREIYRALIMSQIG